MDLIYLLLKELNVDEHIYEVDIAPLATGNQKLKCATIYNAVKLTKYN